MSSFAAVIGIIALAIAPVAFFLWFAYTRDKLEPEPHGLILKLFVLGMVVAIPALLIRQFVPLPYLVMGLVVAPILDELLKFWVVRQGVYNHPEFDEPLDGMIFAAATALGFAAVEISLSMLLAYFRVAQVAVPGASFSWSPLQAVLGLFAIRGLLGGAGHALWSSLWGYSLGLAKFSPRSQRARLIGSGLVAAILSHAVFNALAMEPDWWVNRLGLVLVVLGLVLVVMRCVRYAEAVSPYRES